MSLKVLGFPQDFISSRICDYSLSWGFTSIKENMGYSNRLQKHQTTASPDNQQPEGRDADTKLIQVFGVRFDFSYPRLSLEVANMQKGSKDAGFNGKVNGGD